MTSIVSGNWKNYLKFVILAGGLMMVLMMVLMMTPTSQASSPSKTFEGSTLGDSTVVDIEQKGNGPLVVTAITKTIFVPGDITGELGGPGTLVKLSNGTFRIHTTGIFVGTIDGRTGTAKFTSTVHGVDPNPFGFCCCTGPITLYDGTGGLEGLTAHGTFSNNLIDGNRYSFDVIFR